MGIDQPPQRYKLNTKQIHILKLMYKFRFVTSSLLARYTGVSSPVVINYALEILLDQKYIGRNYDDSYRLRGKGAQYYLAPEALSLLRDEHGMDSIPLHFIYNNKSASQVFVEHNLDVFKVYFVIRDGNPDIFHIYTKTELADHSYFPKPRPDLYLKRIDSKDDQDNEYLLDIFTDSQLFVIKKRIRRYIEHYESGEWEAEVETDYPVILVACPNSNMEEKIQNYAARELDNRGIEDLIVWTTTTRALLEPDNDGKIWSDIYEPEVLLTL